MKPTFISLVAMFICSAASAFTLEPSVAMTAVNEYSIGNIDAKYELSGPLIRLEGLFDFGYPTAIDTTRYFWGVGLGYGMLKGDLEPASLAGPALSASTKFQTYIPYMSIGMAMSGFTIKLMATPYVWIKETEGVNQNDEKYGIGGGLEIGYKAFEYLAFNVGYHTYMCDRGKNASTGQSGTLANDIKLNFVTVGLSFPFSFDSMGSSNGNSRGSSRNGRRGRE